MRTIAILTLGGALLLCGCASNQTKQEAKKIYERPWIGGAFERVANPAAVGTNAQHFGKHGLLITRAREDTPLTKAGLQEGDLLVAVNGTNVRDESNFRKLVERAGPEPLKLTVYRAGEISEKTIAPGLERFQIVHNIMFALPLSPHLDFDLYPNPDFSLVALGYNHKDKRLDLRGGGAV